MTLFELVKRSDCHPSILSAVEGVGGQYGMSPQWEAPCDCEKCTTERADVVRHRDGIEETAWRRTNTAGKSWVLMLLFGNVRVEAIAKHLLEGEEALLRSWKAAKPIAGEIAPPASVQEAEDWLTDVAGVALEALFPWTDVRTSLRACDYVET